MSMKEIIKKEEKRLKELKHLKYNIIVIIFLPKDIKKQLDIEIKNQKDLIKSYKELFAEGIEFEIRP